MAISSESSPNGGLGRRVAARLVDLLVLLSVVVLTAILMSVLRTWGIGAPSTEGVDLRELFQTLGFGKKLAIVFVFFLAQQGLVYFPLFESSGWQATFGKRLLGIYVTGDDGNRISLQRSFVRILARTVASLFLGELISLVLVAASADQKALHDIFAHTRVRKRTTSGDGKLDLWRITVGLGSVVAGIAWMALTLP